MQSLHPELQRRQRAVQALLVFTLSAAVLGRFNCQLCAGSLRSGQRAAAVMTLTQSAKLNGHDPYAYLKDVLTRLPIQKNNTIDELLPHKWKPVVTGKV